MPLDAERIITSVLKVAALPAVAMKFAEAIKNPATSNNDLEKIVSEDSALSAKVLMIANSALFNFPSKIDTISKAITIVGHKQLSEIILSCSVVAMFKGIPQDIIDMDHFWRHSIAVATASRILAAYRHEQNIEKFFTAGLLHDIGKLILFVEAPKYASTVISKCNETKELMHKVEKKVIGFDHAKLGSMLLTKWKLPEEVISSVCYHHIPSVAPRDSLGASIIHVADIMAHALQFGASGEKFVPTLNEKAWLSLELDVEVLDLAVEQLHVQHSEAVKFILG